MPEIYDPETDMTYDPDEPLDLALYRQTVLKEMQETLLTRIRLLNQAKFPVEGAADALKHMATGLRLVAVTPDHAGAQFNAWECLRRAWVAVGLPQEDVHKWAEKVGYEWPVG
jgi:hypothetical protein